MSLQHFLLLCNDKEHVDELSGGVYTFFREKLRQYEKQHGKIDFENSESWRPAIANIFEAFVETHLPSINSAHHHTVKRVFRDTVDILLL